MPGMGLVVVEFDTFDPIISSPALTLVFAHGIGSWLLSVIASRSLFLGDPYGCITLSGYALGLDASLWF